MSSPGRTRFQVDRPWDPPEALAVAPHPAAPAPTPPRPTPEPPAAAPLDDGLGDLLDARYEVRAPLGSGGMSRVWRVYDRVRREDVALKVLRSGVTATRLGSEFRFIASLSHPGIVAVHDFGVTRDRRPYFTMEVVPGQDILAFAEGKPRVVAVEALIAVLETLDFVHARGIVHGDIKPSNILVAPAVASEFAPKLLDFGLAGDRDAARPLRGGTAMYMAPEVIRDEPPDPSSDLYAIGVVLFELLTGRPPFEGPDLATVLHAHLKQPVPDPRDRAPAVPTALAEIALRLLEKAPRDRFASAREVTSALHAWRSRVTAPPRRPSDGGRTAASSVVAPAPRRALAGGARFVGREAAIDAVLARAASLPEPGGLLVVQGEVGSGKTRFLDELRVRLQLAGRDCLTVGFGGCVNPTEPLKRLTAGLQDRLIDRLSAPRVIAELKDRLTLSPGASLPSWGGPEAPLAERLLDAADALAVATVEAARREPLVLLLDDVDAALALGTSGQLPLRRLASRLAGGPALVIAATSGAPEAIAGEDPEIVHLPRLGREATEAMVQSLLGVVSSPDTLVAHVHAESGGNPGAALRVVRALVASGAIVERQGAWAIAEPLGGRLPLLGAEAGLREIARAAVAPLEPLQRRVLSAAALLGERFDEALLAAVLAPSPDPDALSLLLRELVDAQLVEPAAASYGAANDAPASRSAWRFRQRAVRDLLVEGIPPHFLEAWHAAAAAELEQRRARGEAVDLEDYVRHLEGSGAMATAVSVAAAAARELERRGAVDRAARVLGRALDQLQSLASRGDVDARRTWHELAVGLADLERRRGHVDVARDWLQRVIDSATRGLVDVPTVRAESLARQRLGELLFERGDAEAGERELRRALELARSLDQQDLAGSSAASLAFHLILVNRLEEADKLVDEALRTAEALSDAPLTARALKMRATLAWCRGELEEAERDARASAAAHAALGSPRGASEALGALGNALYRRSRFDEARAVFREALEHARQAGWLSGIGKLSNVLAMVEFHRDDWDGACDYWRAALDIADRTGNPIERAILLNNIGLVALHRGEAELATELLTESLTLAREHGLPKIEARALGNLGELYVRTGQLAEAREHLSACLEVARGIEARDEVLECERRLLALALAEGANPSDVAVDAERLVQRAEQIGAASEAPHLQLALGEALARSGRADDAEAMLEAARAGFEALGLGYDAARVVGTASTLAAAGLLAPEGLAADLPKARKLFRRLRAEPELDRARQAQKGLDVGDMRTVAQLVGREPVSGDTFSDLGSDASSGLNVLGAETPEAPASGNTVHGSGLRNAAAALAEEDIPTEPGTSLERLGVGALRESPAARETIGFEPSARRGDTIPFSRHESDLALVAGLLEVTRQMSSILDLDELLCRIVDEAMEMADGDRGHIILCDEGARPKLRVSRGFGGRGLSEEDRQLSRSIMQRVMGERRPITWDDIGARDPAQLSESVAVLGLHAVACFPLMRGRELVGLLYIDSRRPPRVPYRKRLPLLEALCSQAAVLIDNARLFRSQQRKAELLQTIAHELKTPLTAALLHAQRMQTTTEGAHAEHAGVIADQMRRLSRMIGSLVDMSDVEAQAMTWSMVSVQVKELLETTVTSLRPVGDVRRQTVDVDLAKGLPTIYGNRDRLIQVLTNLLSNAIKFSPEGGRISVQARVVDRAELPVAVMDREDLADDLLLAPEPERFAISQDRFVRVDVVDQGPGIPIAERERVFDKFYRGVEATTGPAGIGLGLAISRQIVRHHGGRIWVEDAPGGGARLSVILPVLVQRSDEDEDAAA